MSVEINEIVTIIIGGTIIMMLLIIFIVTFFFIHQKRLTQFVQEKATLKAQYDQEILKSQLEVQNATLQHVGRELHDNIGQLLSVVRINLNILEDSTQDDENQSLIIQSNKIIEQSIHSVRALSKSLDSDFVKDFGLEESIAHQLQGIRKTKKFVTNLTVEGKKYSLGYEREIVLFRIVQEILHNALKHSSAKHIDVHFHYSPNLFKLTASDDGKGFDYEKITKNDDLQHAGAGLRNIQKRANLINFECTLESQEGKGTKYILSTTQTSKEIEK